MRRIDDIVVLENQKDMMAKKLFFETVKDIIKYFGCLFNRGHIDDKFLRWGVKLGIQFSFPDFLYDSDELGNFFLYYDVAINFNNRTLRN